MGGERGEGRTPMSTIDTAPPPSPMVLHQVEHELSVPAVTAIIISVCCFIGSTVSAILLEPNLTPRLRHGMFFLSALVSFAAAAVASTGASFMSVAAAFTGGLIACTCATLVHFLV